MGNVTITKNNRLKKIKNKDVFRFSEFISRNNNKRERKKDNHNIRWKKIGKKWDESVSTQIARYNHIKGSSKRPESFENCIVRFEILKQRITPSSIAKILLLFDRISSTEFLKSKLNSEILMI